MSDKEKIEIVDRAVNQLGEHFEAVQILVSFMSEGNTQMIQRGAGNWYARRGMAHTMIMKDAADENAETIADKLNGGGE